MKQRGPYSKGVAKRAEILDAALTIIARDGYSKATVHQLAEEVGLSQMGLLHYFGSKDALFTAVLRRRDEVDMANYVDAVDSGLAYPEAILKVVEHNTAVPGFVQLYARLSNEAAEANHSAHEYFRERYALVRRETAKQFSALIDAGRLETNADPTELATMLFAMLDGLQTQWMYEPDQIAMTKILRAFLSAIGLKSEVHEPA